ncbi:hypothetical protein N752_06885 [Desulforamulus aquiferis]|nr:hypothetical protein N752_06885 [Desulforamulus aquiferis]
MGHIVNPDREYHLLQQRLDLNVTGAPDSEVFIKILRLLFTPEEANFASQIPLRPTPMVLFHKSWGLLKRNLRNASQI